MTQLQVLDHGFVRLRNIAGPTRRLETKEDHSTERAPIFCSYERPFDADDTDPAQSARMSFNQMDSTRTREADLKLAEYLLKNRHTTPFEMIEIWLEMKLPIFVARQFVRHRTVSINEISGRYVTLLAEWYIPEPQYVGRKAQSQKQGRIITADLEETSLEYVRAANFCSNLDKLCTQSYLLYLDALRDGIPAEEARLCLHLNHYTHWLWKQDLWNMMHFLRLRMHSHAQWESQQYANAIAALLREALPSTMELFDRYLKAG